MARPTDEQIDEQANRASEQVNHGGSKWPGMTYEEGVQNALQWAIGAWDDKPMEDDDD